MYVCIQLCTYVLRRYVHSVSKARTETFVSTYGIRPGRGRSAVGNGTRSAEEVESGRRAPAHLSDLHQQRTFLHPAALPPHKVYVHMYSICSLPLIPAAMNTVDDSQIRILDQKSVCGSCPCPAFSCSTHHLFPQLCPSLFLGAGMAKRAINACRGLAALETNDSSFRPPIRSLLRPADN